MNRPRTLQATALVLVAAIVVGVVAIAALQQTRQSRLSPDKQVSLVDDATLKKLAATNVPIDRTHVAKNLAPPTNKWFSGFALQANPKPGYNYPNSFLPRPDGFEFSLPNVRAEKTIITGAHTADVAVTIDDATSYKLTDYDELTVELTYYDTSDREVATVRLASGLPYVYVTADQDTVVRFTGTATPQETGTSIRSNGALYGVNVSANDNRFSLAAGKSAGFFSVPSDDAYPEVVAHAGAIVRSGDVAYERRGDNIRTTLTYRTANNAPVLFARLPHQGKNETASVTYQSILGNLTTGTGTTLTFDTPAMPVTETLDLSGISGERRQLLTGQLRTDIAAYDDKDDTYFGGKQLFRMAQLLMIAKQLDDDQLVTSAQKTLKRMFEPWLTPGKKTAKSFSHDASMRGIVGNVASFGSDKEFNDHHFHYGYFIYAATILAQYDAGFLNDNKAMINLLVADIANYRSDEALPLRRSFDPYAGHSWASGTAPFTDGNNQESTSEAINAWTGMSLWARRTDNDALALQADWMLSLEYRTARSYWLLQQEPLPDYLAAYDSPIASIVWGGKREYSTFFSDDANAKLAIQLLPLTPSIKRLGDQLPERIFEGTAVERAYGDQLLMARPGATVDQAVALPDAAIDDGNSRTYLYAYILAK